MTLYKSGADWIPMLNMGRDGLREAYKDAERFGMIVSQQAATAADEFNDKLGNMRKSREGRMNTPEAATRQPRKMRPTHFVATNAACPVCGGGFLKTRPWSQFCGDKCRNSNCGYTNIPQEVNHQKHETRSQGNEGRNPSGEVTPSPAGQLELPMSNAKL